MKKTALVFLLLCIAISFTKASNCYKLVYLDTNKQLVFDAERIVFKNELHGNLFSRIIMIGNHGYFFSDDLISTHETKRVFYSFDLNSNKGSTLCVHFITQNELYGDSVLEKRTSSSIKTYILDRQYYSPEMQISKLFYYYRYMFDFYSDFTVTSDLYSIDLFRKDIRATIVKLNYMTPVNGAVCLYPTFSTQGNFLVFIKQTSKRSNNSFNFIKYSKFYICGIDLKRRRFVDFQYCSNNVEYAVLNESTKELLIVSKANGDSVKKISVLDLTSMTITFETLGYSAGWL